MKILIIGGSGGIGSALIDECLCRYPFAEISATYYQHSPRNMNVKINWFKVNIHSEQEISALAILFSQLDLLINTVGILHSHAHQPEKTINAFNVNFFHKNILTNTLPTILLAKYFTPALKSKNTAYFISLSAKIGSIEDNKSGGWLSYRTSKAALNMVIKTISIEWQRSAKNCCILAFHPGTTDTHLSQPFQKHLPTSQLHCAKYTAEKLIELIGHTSAHDSGKFFSYDGSELPW